MSYLQVLVSERELRDSYSSVRIHDDTLKADGSSAVLASGLTQQQIQEILDQHNKLRRDEGASNMEMLVGSISSVCASIKSCRLCDSSQ